MVPVYLCDEDDRFRQEMEEEIRDHIMTAGYDMGILLSTSEPGHLLDSLAQQKNHGIYFLEIVSGGSETEGLELAEQIRRKDVDGFIVYVTTRGDLAGKVFLYHIEALDYILKDNQGLWKQIRTCLDTAVERLCCIKR